MPATITEQTVHLLEIVKEEEIAAPIELVFESILEQMGPLNETPEPSPMPMVLEAWPGGRWYRDLGNGAGHFWGHVQAIKPPVLIEICGPLWMSYAATSNVQYRLSEVNGMTKLQLTHKSMGQVAPDARIETGWSHMTGRIRSAAEKRKG
jgi:uncharacterized protein YndB with AHSA1/START domain